MEKKPIKVLIVDDSQVARDLLKHIIERDPELRVIGTCSNGQEAMDWVNENDVDVITMDVVMPKMNGFEVTRKIMETKPIPIVIITSLYNPKDAVQGFRAMESGALSILEKPGGNLDYHYEKKAKEIVDTIKTIHGVKLIKRTTSEKFKQPHELPEKEVEFAEVIEAVAIGASLGGPAALMSLLSQLNPGFPVPIFIVQHIVPGFTKGLVSWLKEYSKIPIAQAQDGEIAKPGYCYVAPDLCHMEVKRGNVISLDFSKEDGLQPSVSRLFKSMAETYGSRCIGVILTGMGKDGAQELLLMKEKGAYTIAQDEKSCVMFGMPAEAIKLGGARRIMPLDQIPVILNYLTLKNRVLKGKENGRRI